MVSFQSKGLPIKIQEKPIFSFESKKRKKDIFLFKHHQAGRKLLFREESTFIF
jgi:hypothetical protein